MFSEVYLAVKALFFLQISLIFNSLLIIQNVDSFLSHVKSLKYNDKLTPDRSSDIYYIYSISYPFNRVA